MNGRKSMKLSATKIAASVARKIIVIRLLITPDAPVRIRRNCALAGPLVLGLQAQLAGVLRCTSGRRNARSGSETRRLIVGSRRRLRKVLFELAPFFAALQIAVSVLRRFLDDKSGPARRTAPGHRFVPGCKVTTGIG